MTHLTRSLWLYGLEKTPIIRWANWWANQNLDNQKSKEYQQVFRFLQEVVRLEGRPSGSSVLQALNYVKSIQKSPEILDFWGFYFNQFGVVSKIMKKRKIWKNAWQKEISYVYYKQTGSRSVMLY